MKKHEPVGQPVIKQKFKLMLITRPNHLDAPTWCPYFFDLTSEQNLFDAFENNTKWHIDTIDSIPPAKENHRYEDNKWSIKEVLIHLIDTERYYTYGAFSSSRKVNLELDFEHHRDDYVRNFPSEKVTLKEIGAELKKYATFAE